jgi:UDP-3-O-[3-hydroxymyristoyl] glucosamine N-acyltransferase
MNKRTEDAKSKRHRRNSMAISTENLLRDFPELVNWNRGAKDVLISNINNPQLATAESLVFIADEKHLAPALSSGAKALVINTKLLSRLPESEKRTILVSGNPQVLMAKAAKKYFPQTAQRVPVDGHRIHPSAQISKTAELATDVIVGPGAVIGDGCVIGESSVIGANSVLEPKVKIGKRTHVHPLVFIAHHCEIGNDCEIKPHSTIGGEGFGYATDEKGEHSRITHYGRVILEDRVHIGSNVQMDRGTFADSRVGAGTKIDNHCHFGHNVVIGKGTIITGGMITAGSATIGSFCVIGGRTSMAGHISIPDKTQIAGHSGISKTVEKPGAYGGYPLQDLKSHLKTTATFAQLPKLRKQVSMILKKLGMEEL